MCYATLGIVHEAEEVKKEYMKLDAGDRHMVRELILRLQRKAQGLKRKVIYEEDCS